MRKMTCKQLGGTCDFEFQAETFEEIIELSKRHVRLMVEKGDKSHIDALQTMNVIMQSPEVLQEWYKSRRNAFDTSPEV